MASEKHSKNSPPPQLTPWKPGQSGNPKGRPPKTRTIPDILRRIGEEPGTKSGDMTKLDVVLAKVFEYALQGKAWAVEFIANRTEGKALERHEISGIEAQPIAMDVYLHEGETNGKSQSDETDEARKEREREARAEEDD